MATDTNGDYDVEVYFDGGCPLCRREIAALRHRDRRQRIRFTDIDERGFSPESIGRTREQLMSRIHGRLPDGTLIEGPEVFRRLYAAVGFRRLAAFSRWPGIAQALELGYRLFARHRLRLTGRCNATTCPLDSDDRPNTDSQRRAMPRRSPTGSSAH